MFRHLGFLDSLFELLFVEKTSSVSLGIFCFNDTVIWVWVFFIVKLLYLLDFASTIVTLILFNLTLGLWIERALRLNERSRLVFVHSHTFVRHVPTDGQIVSAHDIHDWSVTACIVVFHNWSTQNVISICTTTLEQPCLRDKTLIRHWNFLSLLSLQLPF